LAAGDRHGDVPRLRLRDLIGRDREPVLIADRDRRRLRHAEVRPVVDLVGSGQSRRVGDRLGLLPLEVHQAAVERQRHDADDDRQEDGRHHQHHAAPRGRAMRT
jgi:hypothetical protein